MTITIVVNGTARTYMGDYDEMHTEDWNEKVRELLDSESEV